MRRLLNSNMHGVFTSSKTWGAIGASSCTAFSKWVSLSFRLSEPPCVPSRRSSKWRIRLMMYPGIGLCGIMCLLETISVCGLWVGPFQLAMGHTVIDGHLRLVKRCCERVSRYTAHDGRHEHTKRRRNIATYCDGLQL